ncbi:TlpA family protein disulfide reductase [Dawidia soli]|uniref:Redoxin domain-containing protein n=1 Tax=Dawidia soli TaxID=2782352 RepID=A0AAP2GGB0_9BACT|nr:redoxin family protein [Dawidia soli]MBT1690364.1 redoxin domain-containing protein [Dawidia soli]
MRKVLVGLLLLAVSGSVALLFWSQELKYVMPTPVPAHFVSPAVNRPVDLTLLDGYQPGKPVYIHFFNPDCPCSRFNLKHFHALANQFGNRVQVFAVIPAYADPGRAREMIGTDNDSVVILQDHADSLASICGVYATPQAVVIDAQRRLYYRGNYNKSRYCTTKDSNYAERALRALVAGQAAPQFGPWATQPYGCELPDAEDRSNAFVNLFR